MKQWLSFSVLWEGNFIHYCVTVMSVRLGFSVFSQWYILHIKCKGSITMTWLSQPHLWVQDAYLMKVMALGHKTHAIRCTSLGWWCCNHWHILFTYLPVCFVYSGQQITASAHTSAEPYIIKAATIPTSVPTQWPRHTISFLQWGYCKWLWKQVLWMHTCDRGATGGCSGTHYCWQR